MDVHHTKTSTIIYVEQTKTMNLFFLKREIKGFCNRRYKQGLKVIGTRCVAVILIHHIMNPRSF